MSFNQVGSITSFTAGTVIVSTDVNTINTTFKDSINSLITGSNELAGGISVGGSLTVASGGFTVTAGGIVLTAGVLSVDDGTDTTSTITGSIHTDGGLGIAKALWVGTTSRFVGVTTHGGNVISDTDSTDDLGTTGVRWANLWVDDVTATTSVKPGTLVLAAGSITDTSGAIDFANENLTTTGTVDISYTATENDLHALEIDLNAATFGDVNAIHIAYTTGNISAGEDSGVILVNIDESAASGGDVIGLEVLATEGSASAFGMRVGATVNVIEQLSGSFSDMDSALVNSTDRLAAFISTGSDIQMFVANSDTVTIGNTAKFEEIEFLLAIDASGAGIKPTFDYSTGSGTWQPFTPTDGTRGFRDTGLIAWDAADTASPAWAFGVGGSEYFIRITRTAGTLGTPPTEDRVQIAVVSEFSWDKDGDLAVNTLAGTISTATQNSITTMTGLVTTGALASGTIATGFGNINNAANTLTTGALTATTGTFSGVVTIDDTDEWLLLTDTASSGSVDLTFQNGTTGTGAA
ncbi:hypothetical protein LCGC14_1523220, partial [marine sediment metagenome]